MAIQLIVPPDPNPTPAPVLTPTQQTVVAIQQILQTAAIQLVASYKQARRMSGFTADGNNPFGLTTEEVFAAIEVAKPCGVNAAGLANFAILIKTVFEAIQPGVIVDEVPTAIITMPSA
jgi:hypothetical protein